MADAMAFGRWEAYRLNGNPYVDGVEKVYLPFPRVAVMRDLTNRRMGFVAVRLKGSDDFMLPKSSPKVKPVYYAIYSPIEEWVRNPNGYSPLPGSSAQSLVNSLVSEFVSGLSKAEDPDEFTALPLTYRQMLLHASRRANMSVSTYVGTLPEQTREKALQSFQLDVPADQ